MSGNIAAKTASEKATNLARRDMPKQARHARADSLQDRMMELQRAAGNQAVAEFVSRPDAEENRSQPLDGDIRREMESHFDADFSNVRIHTGVEAKERTSSESALAFTQGNDIYIGGDATQPGYGREVLAHELTHVRQQSTSGRSGKVNSSDELEREADLASSAVTANRSVRVDSGTAPRGAVQKLDRRGIEDPEKENIRKGLLNVPESWKDFIDNPKFSEVMSENPDILQRLKGDPDFWKALRDPAFRPRRQVTNDAPATPKSQEPEAPEAFSEFPPLKVITPDQNPPPQGEPRKSAKQNYMESFERKASRQQKAEAKHPARLPEFYGEYQRAQERAVAETKQMIGAFFPLGGTLGWDLAELVTGETATNRPVDRLEKAKEVLEGALMQGTLFLGPEGKLVEGVEGLGGGLREGAAVVPESTGEVGGAVQEGADILPEKSGSSGEVLQSPEPVTDIPTAEPIGEVLEPTAPPGAQHPEGFSEGAIDISPEDSAEIPLEPTSHPPTGSQTNPKLPQETRTETPLDTQMRQMRESKPESFKQPDAYEGDKLAKVNTEEEQLAGIREQRVKDQVRSASPPRNLKGGRVTREGLSKVEVGKPDPAFPDEVVEEVETDHISSLERMYEMEGAAYLDRAELEEISNIEENFTSMSKRVNGSRKDLTFKEWAGTELGKKANKEWLSTMIATEEKVELTIQQRISALVKKKFESGVYPYATPFK